MTSWLNKLRVIISELVVPEAEILAAHVRMHHLHPQKDEVGSLQGASKAQLSLCIRECSRGSH